MFSISFVQFPRLHHAFGLHSPHSLGSLCSLPCQRIPSRTSLLGCCRFVMLFFLFTNSKLLFSFASLMLYSLSALFALFEPYGSAALSTLSLKFVCSSASELFALSTLSVFPCTSPFWMSSTPSALLVLSVLLTLSAFLSFLTIFLNQLLCFHTMKRFYGSHPLHCFHVEPLQARNCTVTFFQIRGSALPHSAEVPNLCHLITAALF